MQCYGEAGKKGIQNRFHSIQAFDLINIISETEWDFYWADREFIYDVLDTVHLDVGQKVNHFRNGREVCFV